MRYLSLILLIVVCLMPLSLTAQQAPTPLPTQHQLELRLADAAAQNQRTLCATLWQQGNEIEQQLKKLQADYDALKLKHEASLKNTEEKLDAPIQP